MQVMSHPGVDYTRTVSNHIIDIIDVLGIEAARAALLKVGFPCILTHRLGQLEYWSHRPKHTWATVSHNRWEAEYVISNDLLMGPSIVSHDNVDPSTVP